MICSRMLRVRSSLDFASTTLKAYLFPGPSFFDVRECDVAAGRGVVQAAVPGNFFMSRVSSDILAFPFLCCNALT